MTHDSIGDLSLAELRERFGANLEQLDSEEILYFTAEHPDLPALEDLANSRRNEILSAIVEAEELGRHEGAPLAAAITPPDELRDRLSRVRDAAARLLGLRRLLESGDVDLFLVELDDGAFDAVLRVNPFTAAKCDAGSDQALPPGPARD